MTQEAPHLLDLNGYQAGEARSDLGAGQVVCVPAGTGSASSVVTDVRMVERDLHESGERDWPRSLDLGGDLTSGGSAMQGGAGHHWDTSK
jgi:hypothetical protein